MIYIKYYTMTYAADKPVVDKYTDGPYLKTFETLDEALDWVRSHDIEIANIDIM